MNNPSEVVNDERKYKIQRIEVDFSAKTKLTSLLGSENEKIRSRAVDQIVKYTGNDIEKIAAKIDGNITLNWGDSIEGNDPGDEQQ